MPSGQSQRRNFAPSIKRSREQADRSGAGRGRVTGPSAHSMNEYGEAAWPLSRLLPWTTRMVRGFKPEERLAPRGWNEETLSSFEAFDDERRRRETFARDDYDDLRLRAEVTLILGNGSLADRAECVEILKAPPPSKRKRGASGYANLPRDVMILTLVNAVCRLGALRPTRNEASSKMECGCSVVAQAMGLVGRPIAEKTVAGIYQRCVQRLAEADERLE